MFRYTDNNSHSVKIDEDYEQSKLPSGCLESLVDDARDEPNPRAVQSILGFMSETIKSEWLIDSLTLMKKTNLTNQNLSFPCSSSHMYNKKSYDS